MAETRIVTAELRPHTGKKFADYAAGSVKRYDVPDKTVAMLMAIVADEMKVPVSELRFLSIRDITEEVSGK